MRVSIAGKVLLAVAASFLVAVLLTVAVVTGQLATLVDGQQRALSEQQVALLLRQCNAAERRRQTAPPPGEHLAQTQAELLGNLRGTYLQDLAPGGAHPMVLDAAGRLLLGTAGDPATAGGLGTVRALSPGRGEIHYTDASGQSRLAVLAQFPPWGWSLGWSVPVAAKHAAVQQVRTLLLAVLGTSFAGLAGLLYMLLRRMLRPVAALTAAAAALSRGDPNHPVAATSGDEVGTLARAFGEMRDAVHHQMGAVRRSEQKYRELVQSANSVILRWDRAGKVLFMNHYGLRLFGFSAAELVGNPVVGTIVPDTESSGRDLRDLIRDILLDPARHALNENENVCKDGRRLRIQWTNRPVTDEAGRFQEILSVGTDITERERLKGDLRRAQKMEAIGTLAGGVAHDFNNILAAIVGHADYAALRAEPGSPIAEALRQVLRAAERARELVQQILTFSRRTEQARHPLRLAPIVKEALQLLRSSIPTTIEIRPQIESSSAVLADPTRMHQVVMNLCTNAYQAMARRGGVLTVGLHDVTLGRLPGDPLEEVPEGQYLVLEVGDTGPGMDAETRGKIFEPYFTTKGPGEGSGLGLAVVDGIVADHQGAIRVESTPDRGTTVRVYLPAVPGAGDLPDTLPQPAPVPGGHERLLFVDDEEALRTVARRVFGEAGYRVEVCADGQVALDVVHEDPSRWDLVITDMAMPAMSGETLLEQLRHLRPDLPVILCTGYSATMNHERAMALGAAGFFTKPLAMSELALQVRRILDGKT